MKFSMNSSLFVTISNLGLRPKIQYVQYDFVDEQLTNLNLSFCLKVWYTMFLLRKQEHMWHMAHLDPKRPMQLLHHWWSWDQLHLFFQPHPQASLLWPSSSPSASCRSSKLLQRPQRGPGNHGRIGEYVRMWCFVKYIPVPVFKTSSCIIVWKTAGLGFVKPLEFFVDNLEVLLKRLGIIHFSVLKISQVVVDLFHFRRKGHRFFTKIATVLKSA